MKEPWSLILIFLILLAVMLFCIQEIQENEKTKHDAANVYFGNSAGVVLRGGAGADKSWIGNTNDYPVIIKHINQSQGDRILDIFVLSPHANKDIEVVFDDGFIITQVVVGSIMEVGFISATPPKKSSLFRAFLEEVFDAKESSMA